VRLLAIQGAGSSRHLAPISPLRSWATERQARGQ
jgi:hypothetical protein